MEEYIKNFWFDYFASNHQRLIKNANHETTLSTVIHISFIQGINLLTILLLLISLFFPNIRLDYIFFISPIIILIVINSYYFYYMLDKQKRESIIVRKPKYKRYMYDLYDLFSVILSGLVAYILSKM